MTLSDIKVVCFLEDYKLLGIEITWCIEIGYRSYDMQVHIKIWILHTRLSSLKLHPHPTPQRRVQWKGSIVQWNELHWHNVMDDDRTLIWFWEIYKNIRLSPFWVPSIDYCTEFIFHVSFITMSNWPTWNSIPVIIIMD